MIYRALRLAVPFALTVVVLAAGCARRGSDYPTKQVELIVPFAPGGATDLTARALAENVSKKLEQPVSVVNKTAGGGTGGTLEAIQAKPDGYTLLATSVTSSTLNPAVVSDLPYKWDQYTFIALLVTSPQVFVVNADSPWTTLKDLVEDVRKEPTRFKYGSAGPGGPSTFGVAQVMEQAGVDPNTLTRVAFQGGGPTVTALAGGHVDFASQHLAEVADLVKGGKLRGLAISSDARVTMLPDVPTAKEAGFDRYTFQGYTGLAAPPNTPKNVVDRWTQVIKEAMADPAFTEQLEGLGLTAAYLGPDQYQDWARKEYEGAVAIADRLKLRQ